MTTSNAECRRRILSHMDFVSPEVLQEVSDSVFDPEFGYRRLQAVLDSDEYGRLPVTERCELQSFVVDALWDACAPALVAAVILVFVDAYGQASVAQSALRRLDGFTGGNANKWL